MNIDDLLNDSKEVPFEIGGKKGTLKMQSPSGDAARQVRLKYTQAGTQFHSGEKVNVLAGLDEIMTSAVRACIKPGEADDTTDDNLQLFLLRIGGQQSEVVKYAFEMCGVADLQKDDDELPSDTQGDHLDFTSRE